MRRITLAVIGLLLVAAFVLCSFLATEPLVAAQGPRPSDSSPGIAAIKPRQVSWRSASDDHACLVALRCAFGELDPTPTPTKTRPGGARAYLPLMLKNAQPRAPLIALDRGAMDPALKQAADGSVWLVGHYQENWQPFWTVSRDGGETWSEPALLWDEWGYDLDLAQSPEGRIWAAWAASSPDPTYDPRYSTTTDGGRTWSNVRRLFVPPDYDTVMSVVAMSTTETWLCWEGGCIPSTDGGQTWGAVRSMPSFGWTNATYTRTRDGRLWIATVAGGRTVQVQWSRDQGLTWSPPVTVANVESAPDMPAGIRPVARLIEDHAGQLWLAWYAYRSTTHSSQVWFAKSTDGGITWSLPTQVTTDPSSHGTYFSNISIAEVDGQIWVVYASDRTGRYQIYRDVVAAAPPLPTYTATLTNTPMPTSTYTPTATVTLTPLPTNFVTDGLDGDWVGRTPAATDASGDSLCGAGTDLTAFYYVSTPESLYIMQRVADDRAGEGWFHFHIDATNGSAAQHMILDLTSTKSDLLDEDAWLVIGHPAGAVQVVAEACLPWAMLGSPVRVEIWPVAPGATACDGFATAIVVTGPATPVPTWTPTQTPSATPTPTSTRTASPTWTATRTLTPTPTSTPTASPTTTGAARLVVRAYVDGRSQFIVRRDTVHWHHLDWAAPGRQGGANEPTYLNGAPWYPTWPDSSGAENAWCDCDSSTYTGVPLLATQPQTITLETTWGRGSVTIVQQPSASNDWTLAVEFNDNDWGYADWYQITLDYASPSSAVSGPAVLLLVKASLAPALGPAHQPFEADLESDGYTVRKVADSATPPDIKNLTGKGTLLRLESSSTDDEDLQIFLAIIGKTMMAAGQV